MKRIILSLLLTVIAVAGWGQEEFTIDKINYVVTGENTCSVLGAESDIAGDIVIPNAVSYDNVTYDVKSISEAAFIGTNCTSVVVSDGITTISQHAFLGCPKLTSVTLPSSLTEIVRSGNIHINVKPACLTHDKFVNNSSITNEEAAGMLGIYLCDVRTDDGLAIKNNNVEFYFNYGNDLSVNIPEGITGAQFSVFSYDNLFTSITIPSTFKLGESFYPSGMSYASKSGFKNNTKYPDEEVAAYLGVLLYDEITADGLIINNNKVLRYVGNGGKVNIPEGVVSIDNIAFLHDEKIESVIIPSSVTNIGNQAFDYCTALKEVTIKGQNVNIGFRAFKGCDALEKFTIYATTPPDISGQDIFYNMAFSNATLYVQSTSVEAYSISHVWKEFENIRNLESAPYTRTTSASKIKYFLFDNDNTGWVIGTESDIEGDIVIPSILEYDNKDYTITTIKSKAFASTNITSAVVSEGITTIESEAFINCSNLEAITLPTTLHNIIEYSNPPTSSYIFKDRFINRSEFPDYEVLWCLGIELYDNKTADGLLLYGDILVGYVGSNEPGFSISLPEGITGISSSAFWNSNVGSIVIPESVTSIPSNVFPSCLLLTDITIKGQNVSFGIGAFTKCAVNNITLYAVTPPALDYVLFSYLSYTRYDYVTLNVPFLSVQSYKNAPQWERFKNIVGIETPGVHLISEKKIKYALFDSDNTGWVIGAESDIEGDIVIPSSVRYDNKDFAIKKIDVGAFMSTNINSAVVSEGITTIGAYAFHACPNLQSVTLPSSLNELIWELVPDRTTSLYLLTSKFKNNSQIDDMEVANCLGFNICDEMTDDGLAILDHKVVGYIGNNEPGLSITIPEGVTTIVPIFTWSNLETIVLPESVTKIGSAAFYFNYHFSKSYIKNVTIKGQNVDMGEYAFFDNSDIENITLYAMTPPDISGKNVFCLSNYNKATLNVPFTSVNAYKSAPEWKNFKNIVGFVPEGNFIHHLLNCKEEELTGDENAYLTLDDSEKRYVNGDGHEYDSNGLCKHCGQPKKCAKPTYDAENGLRCKTEGVEYEIKSGYWIATSPEMPADISLTIIAKKDGYIDSDPLLLSISKLDLNNDGKFDLNDLKYLQDKVLEK